MNLIIFILYKIFHAQLFFMMPQIRTSKLHLKILHIFALLLVTIPSLLYTFYYIPNIGLYTSVILSTIFSIRLYNELRLPNIVDNGRLNPPSSVYSNKKNRLNKTIQAFILMCIGYGLQYYKSQTVPFIYVAPEFIGYIILLVSAFNYASCAYDFPISWNI
jgi:hypothetical protein